MKVRFKSFYNYTRGYDGTITLMKSWKVKVVYWMLFGIVLYKKRYVIDL